VVVAGTHSGVGKTTVATGLMAALANRGLTVASAKVGPDFIDPGYHAVATGRPAHNLDAWICGAASVAPLAARAAVGSDVLVVEGVMGLFDGASWWPEPDVADRDSPGGPSPAGEASTAETAVLLGAPVILVVDGSSMSTSVAALVHGFASYRPDVHLAGVIVNRVGSPHHEELLRQALEPLGRRGVPVLGVLHRQDAFTWRDRHLGLVPVVEHPEQVRASVQRVAEAVAAGVDLEAVLAVARSAPPVPEGGIGRLTSTERVAPPGRPPRVAVAGGPAFSFAYPDTLRRLAEAGAELVAFDPIADTSLPEAIDGLYAGGGFPEIYAEALAANRPLLESVRQRVAGGMPTWAECGGMLWLSRSLDGHRLCGVLDAHGRMGDRLHLGYRTAQASVDSPVIGAGQVVRGHEFHYSTLEPAGDALLLHGRSGGGPDGFASPTLLATYLHQHLGADPRPAERLVAASVAAAARPVG
jgi:cobyrinic acid a,c-diamide synthase